MTWEYNVDKKLRVGGSPAQPPSHNITHTVIETKPQHKAVTCWPLVCHKTKHDQKAKKKIHSIFSKPWAFQYAFSISSEATTCNSTPLPPALWAGGKQRHLDSSADMQIQV